MPSKTLDGRKRIFLEYLADNEIKDIQLIPSGDFKRLLLRLVRYKHVSNFPIDTILPNLCEYVFSDNCGAHITGLKRVGLDGDENSTPKDGEFNKDEIFIVETYEVIVNKN